jgi:hypothetical protein
LIVIALYVITIMTLMSTSTYDTWGGVLIAPVLIIATLPALRRQAAREGDPRVFTLLCWGLIAKLAGGVAKFAFASVIYDNRGDAFEYQRDALALMDRWASGHIHISAALDSPESFITWVTAAVDTLLRPSLLAGFLVFSWFAFWGLFWFYRAFRLAVPEGRGRTYAALLFFLPSLVYWPSSIGKEAWMVFTLGLASFGAASLLTKARAISLVPLLLGLLGAAAVRPHYAGIAAIALVCAFIIKKPAATLGSLAPLVKLAAIAGVVVLAAFLLQRTSAFLTQSGIAVQGGLTSIGGVRDALGDIGDRTEQGGSEFHVQGLTTPTGIALSIPTVLFRPLPFEAHEAQIMMAAIESMGLLIFAAIRWRWIWASLRSIRRRPYMAYVVAFVFGGILVLSSIANFGILARQRTVILPAMLVLLCIPPPPRRSARRTRHDEEAASELVSAA